MSLENVLSSIRGYCQSFDVSSSEEEGAIEASGELVMKTALTKIQRLGKSLIASDESKVDLLLEIDREVRKLDEYCTSSIEHQTTSFVSQAKKARLQTERIIQSVDEALFETFLKLDASDQDNKLRNHKFLKRMEIFVSHADQGKVRDSELGDVLFHQLLRCKSETARQLALICLDAGAEINCRNSRGATGLHLAAQVGDKSLVKELIKRGGDQSIKASSRLLSPLEVAINSQNYSCVLALALENPFQKIGERSAPEYFIEQLQYSRRGLEAENLIQLLDKFSSKVEINSFADGCWKACKEVTTAWVEEHFNDLEVVIDWLLSHDVRTERGPDEQFLVTWLAERILGRKLNGKNDEALLEKMIDRGYLQLAISASNRSILLELHQQIITGQLSASSRLANIIRESTEELPLGAYEELNKLVSQIKSEWDLSTQSDIYKKIEKRIAELREKNFPNFQMVEKKLKDSLEWEINRIEEYRNVSLKLVEGKDVEGVSISVYNYLLGQYVENKRWDLIPKLDIGANRYSQEFVANKLIYHLMMDKLLFKEAEKYISLRPTITANALIRALDRVNEINSEGALEQNLKKIVPIIHKYLTPLLKEFILLNALDRDPQKFSVSVVEKIKNLDVGGSLLVPSGCINHGTCLLIERRGPETFRIIHYNTGRGVMKWHYRGKKTNKCQTFDMVDNVPTASILNQQEWKYLLYSYSSMDPIYECIRNELGKGGERVTRSEHEQDYESKQSAGTCAMQALMALLRHQIMQLSEGTPSERLALYKLFKSQMFTQFHHDHLEQIDETVHRNLSTVINKLGAQRALVDLAANMEAFDEALTSITDILDGLGEKRLAKTLLSRDKTTNLSRYATLRNASNILCGAWLNHPEAIPPTELKQQKDLQLAFAKFEHQSAIIRNINSRLQKHSEMGDMKELAFELYRTILATSFTKMGIQEAVKRLGKEEPPYEGTVHLLKNLNSYREQSEPVVKEFKLLLFEDNPEQSKWVEGFWQELGKEPVEKGKTFD